MSPPRIRPLARAAMLAAALAMAFAPPVAAQGVMGRLKGASGYSVSGKKGPFIKQAAGRISAGGGAGAMGLATDAINRGEYQAARLRMPETERRLTELVNRLDGGWPYAKTGPVKVYMLGLDHYGAQSLPDGSILIPIGLLERAQSDDEIAFVLAHELAHIRLNHFAKAAKLQGRRRAISRLGQLYVTGSAVRSGAVNVSSGGVGVDENDARVGRAAQRASAANDLIHFVNDVMVAPAWSMAQEDEADALGFDLVNLSNWAAESASARVFDTLQADEDRRESLTGDLEGEMQTSLGTAAKNNSAQSLLSGGLDPGNVGGSVLRGAGRIALSVAGSAQGGAQHRTPEARKKGMADYTNDAYPEGLALRDEADGWLKQLRAGREYQAARTATLAVKASMAARAEGNPNAARVEIARAMATPFQSAPMVGNEAARIEDDAGQFDRADALFTRASASPDQTVDGYVDHARMLHHAGRYDRALAVIGQAVPRYGNDDKPFLSLLIAIHFKLGRDDEALNYLRRCMDYGDAALKNDCSLAALNPGDPSQYQRLNGERRAEVDKLARKRGKKDGPNTNLRSLGLPIGN